MLTFYDNIAIVTDNALECGCRHPFFRIVLEYTIFSKLYDKIGRLREPTRAILSVR